jgi:hypothetical protein
MVLVLAAAASVGGRSGAANAAPPVDPPVFSSPLNITNPYFPFTVGGIKLFAGLSDRRPVAFMDLYLDETRPFQVNGGNVPTRILQETAFEDGKLLEISHNYFAQADDGTVYYFGEVVDIYEDGAVINHEGSWLVGGPTEPGDPPDVGNASVPAVFMPGHPELGDRFKPEDVFPVADETGTVVGVGQRVVVPAGRFKNTLRVKETTRLDPGSETKWYAPGVGVVKAKSRGERYGLIASTF